MKQLLKNIQGKTALALSLLVLSIAAVGATATSLETTSKIMYVVLAILGGIGAVKVYKKWKSGASDVHVTAITWLGSFTLFLMANTLMRSIILN